MLFNSVKPAPFPKSNLVIEPDQREVGKVSSMSSRIFGGIFNNNPIEKEHIYAAACQYFIAVSNSLPKELKNPGSQGFIAWSACLKYLEKHRAEHEFKFSTDALEYVRKIAATIGGCAEKLSIDIRSQVSADLKNLNLFSSEFLDEAAQRMTMETLKMEDCVDDSGMLKGNWVVLFREDGRFFVVQDTPKKHVTDLLLKDANLEIPRAGICKPHVTINEGQFQKRKDVEERLLSKGLTIENCDKKIIEDNQIEFNEKLPYFLVMTVKGERLQLSDIKPTRVHVVNNPRPEVKRVFVLQVASESLEKFKEELNIYPVNRSILPHISLGNEFRKLEGQETLCNFKDIWSDLGGGDHVDQVAELVEKMWPTASI